MDPQASQQFILKILSGPHLGAEVVLGSGTYSIGQDEHNDIVLLDDTILPEHLIIEIKQDEFCVTKIEQAVSLFKKNQQIDDDHTRADFYDVIQSACFHFTIGPVGQNWPELEFHNYALGDKDSDSGEDSAAHDAIVPRPIDQEAATSEVKKRWRSGKLFDKRLAAVLATLAISLTFGVKLQGSQQTLQEAAEPIHISQQQVLEALRKDEQWQKLSFEKQTNDRVLITGYLHGDQQRVLEQHLQSAKLNYSLNIYIYAQLIADMRYLFSAMNENEVQINQQEQEGEFSVSGFMGDWQKWQSIERKVLTDIPGVLALSRPEEDLLDAEVSWLQQVFTEQRIKLRVEVERQQSESLLYVEKRFVKHQKLLNIAEEFYQAFERLLVLTPTSKKQNHGWNISGISLGEVPYITTNSGQRIIAGGRMENGFTVDEITAKAVYFKRGEQRIKYELEGG